jgi:hypothetical protein
MHARFSPSGINAVNPIKFETNVKIKNTKSSPED